VDPDSAEAVSLRYLGLENVESVTGTILLSGAGANAAIGRSTTFRFDQRHVLYGKLRPYLNKVALPDFEGRCTTELIPLLPRPGVSREFLALLLRRPQTVAAAMREKTGARMPRANIPDLLRLCVTVPCQLEDQLMVAQRLVQELAFVDNARAACENQLRLLETYRHMRLMQFGGPKTA
jgi:type I restriction enzyme S subunit